MADRYSPVPNMRRELSGRIALVSCMCEVNSLYPDGMFYADQQDRFGVEYYGIHARWLCDVITSGHTDEYRLHTYAGVKLLRNFPISRSLAADHRRTAFFGVSAIQCASVDPTDSEIEPSFGDFGSS